MLVTKYYRKTPVEAIQWTGRNPLDVVNFLSGLGHASMLDYDNMIEFGPNQDEWWENSRRVCPGQWLVSDEHKVSVYTNDAFHSVFGEYKDE